MTSRIEDFKSAVVVAISEKLPELKDCKAIGGRFNLDVLLEKSVKAPAVFFSVLKSPLKILPSGQISIEAKCAAYILTEGHENKREKAAMVIAEAIAIMLGENQPWNTVKAGQPEKGEIDPLISADNRKSGVTLLAVTWTQTIRHLGTSIFADDGTVITQLYVNDELVVDLEQEAE